MLTYRAVCIKSYRSYTGLYEIIHIPYQIWTVTAKIGFSIRFCVFRTNYNLDISFHRNKIRSLVAIFWECWKVVDNPCVKYDVSFLLNFSAIIWQVCVFFQWDINVRKQSKPEEIAEKCSIWHFTRKFRIPKLRKKKTSFQIHFHYDDLFNFWKKGKHNGRKEAAISIQNVTKGILLSKMKTER